MYKSITKICKMFDVSPNFIKKHFADKLKEGKHFVYVGTLKRYNEDEMKKLLIGDGTKNTHSNILDKFLI